MRGHEFLGEMPISITHLQQNPDGETSSFRTDDNNLRASTKGRLKINKVWSTSVVDVDLYTFDVGIEPSAALTYALDDRWGGDPYSTLAGLEASVKANPDAIAIVFTNNEGARRMPLTGWMIAHRMYHALQSRKNGPLHMARSAGLNALDDVLYKHLDSIMVDLQNYSEDLSRDPTLMACLMGSTKACRDFNLTSSGELIPECFAQYLLRGKVTLRQLPPRVKINGVTYTTIQGNLGYSNNRVQKFEDSLNEGYAQIIEAARGKVFAL